MSVFDALGLDKRTATNARQGFPPVESLCCPRWTIARDEKDGTEALCSAF
jgi:hypothetical protein